MTIKLYTSDGNTLAGAAAVIGTAVAALTQRKINAATVCNSTGAPVAFTAYLVPSGGSPDATNIMISAHTISVGESYMCPELVNQSLNAGGTVQAFGTGLTFKYSATDFQ